VSEEQFKSIMAELIETRIRIGQANETLFEIHRAIHAILAWIFIASIFFAFK
jgi:hypothetical protein